LGVAADMIGFHGQTILHRPQQGRTWQIGDAALLARETGTPVAWDFRTADVHAGGQGAPLVPVFHAALAAAFDRPLAVLNIGGVANVTWIGAHDIAAWDTGPGNALLDDFCARHLGEPMDRDGRLAATGTPNEAILAELLAHPFFRRPPPKSLDRQDFAHALQKVEGLNMADGAATLAAFTARAISASPWPLPPRQMLVAGGGRHNPAIMAALRATLACPVAPAEDAGWNGDALEAQCFAYLAARVQRGLPLSFPGTTGVPVPTPGGAIAMPNG
jgi:anhydro-N-acetylmuramic acid kinase